MILVRYLLFKYLRFDKTQPFIMLCAILAFLGVSVGIMVLIIAMAIMNGFDKEFERKLFTMNYPITILGFYKGQINSELNTNLTQNFKNMTFSPFINSQIVAKTSSGLEGGIIFGVNLDLEKKINSVIRDASKDLNLDNYGIIVGKGLMDSYFLQNQDKITIIFTKTDQAGVALLPKMKRFEIRGFFESGLISYDKGYFYVDIESLSKILNYEEGVYDGIHVFSNKPFEDIKKLKEYLPQDIKAIGWWEQNGNFFSALALEKRALFIVLMLIILIASLNIISSLLMTVMNRRHEIALLLSLGTSKKEIKKIFFSLGLVIGGSGIVVGCTLGFIGVFLLGNFNIVNLPADVYGSSKLPIELSIVDVISIILGSIFIVILSSFYPAKKSSEVDVLQTLRSE